MSALLDTVHRVDPAADVRRARAMDDALAETIRLRRFQAFLFWGVGCAGLVLLGVGLLGLIAMTTARRTREIDVRMALGASPAKIVRQLLREQLAAVALGLLAGSLISAWVLRSLSAYLYGLTAYDPWAWGTAVSVIVATAGLGAVLPSLRAAHIHPIQALRTD